jgi:hypothetical protein
MLDEHTTLGNYREDDYEVDEGCNYRPKVIVKSTHTCRYCGERGLKWTRHNELWLLGDGKKVHKCPVNPYKEK